MKPTLVIIRHGDTQMNDKNELRGWDDPELNPAGHKSAKEAAEKVVKKGIPLKHIYTGTLQRTKETGQYLADATSVPTSHTDALNPWDYGDITGKPEDRQQRKNLKFFMDRPNMKTPNGESYGEFKDRYSSALLKARDHVLANPDQAVALVTHSRNLYPTEHILNGNVGDIPTKSDEFGPGTVHVYEFEPDGKFNKKKL